jgi:tryptophan synthase alpha chain
MSRLPAMFDRLRAEGRTGLIAYITAGYPTPQETVPLVRALLDGGADAIELGVPFSDPLADGATIQRSTHEALAQGETMAQVLDAVQRLRAEGVTAPLLTMGYMNSILAYGVERFAGDAAAAGLDGFIVVDLPPEEADELQTACRARDLDLIFLVAPTSTDERLAAIGRRASGFIYCVSVTGTTGARVGVSEELPEFIGRVRAHTDLPLVVGFGISRPEHVARVGEICEAAAIGSAIIDTIERAPAAERVENLRRYVEVVTGRQRV